MTRAKQIGGRSSWKWYGVRSLYRSVALGEPRNPDASYIPSATLVEERIVLIKARSGKEALRKAKKEGKAYTRSAPVTNCYGQKVRTRRLKGLEAYELFEYPSSGAEVFSAMEEIDSSIPDERICQRPIGCGEPTEQQENFWRRFKFIHVRVVRLLAEHLQKSPPSSRTGDEHGQ